MTVKRFAWALVLAAASAGCGDSGGGGGSGGSPYPNCPECMHWQYVVGPKMPGVATDHGITVPQSTAMATALGCDINHDNEIDNRLGGVLAAIKNVSPTTDIQAAVDSSFMNGTLIILFDVEAKPGIDNATVAGIKGYLGGHDASDGLQAPAFYTGMGKFTVTMSTGPGFGGTITTGAAHFGPGNLTVQFPLVMDQPPLTVDLIAGEVNGTISASGIINGKLCGAIPADELKNTILPRVADLLSAQVKRGGSAADTIKGLFDKNPTYPECANDPTNTNCSTDPNCQAGSPPANLCHCISTCEVEHNSIIQSTLGPDLDLDPNKTNPFAKPGDADYKNDALSLGLGFEASKATFPAQ